MSNKSDIEFNISILSDNIDFHREQFKEATKECRHKLKSLRIQLARETARLNGEQIGRKMKRDNAEIIRLRKEGLSIKAIAQKLGCSTMPVQQALKCLIKNQSEGGV